MGFKIGGTLGKIGGNIARAVGKAAKDVSGIPIVGDALRHVLTPVAVLGTKAGGASWGESAKVGAQTALGAYGGALTKAIPSVGKSALGRVALNTATGLASGKSLGSAAASAAGREALGAVGRRLPSVGRTVTPYTTEPYGSYDPSEGLGDTPHNPAVSGVRGLFTGGGKDGVGNRGVIGDLAGGLFSGGGRDGTGERGIVGDVFGRFDGNGEGEGFGVDEALDAATGAYNAYELAQLRNKMEKRMDAADAESKALRDEALSMACNDWNNRGQFRDAATPMLFAKRPDLSNLSGYSNPYTKKPAATGLTANPANTPEVLAGGVRNVPMPTQQATPGDGGITVAQMEAEIRRLLGKGGIPGVGGGAR